MRNGWKAAILVFGIAMIIVSGAGGGGMRPASRKVPEGWKFTVPRGDAETGKAVFMMMECYACHKIQSSDLKLPLPSGTDGPDLTGYSTLPREYLADSIIRAHRVVAAPGYVVRKGKAGMGKYNHFMTIQELIDLTAFLKEKS